MHFPRIVEQPRSCRKNRRNREWDGGAAGAKPAQNQAGLRDIAHRVET